jgi:FkbM family methyltransferase
MRKLINIDNDLHMLYHLKKYLLMCPDTEKLISYFSRDCSAIDIGACSGEYSYALAKNFQRVLSIEPIPEAILLLKKTLPRNCEVVECAMGEAYGEVCLRIPKVGNHRIGALATAASHDFDFSDIEDVDNITVNKLTLDGIVFEKNLKPSFVKIDVEGYEMNVLHGSIKVIENYKPIFMIEIEKRHNKEYREIFYFFHSKGYDQYYFRNNKLCALNHDVVNESYEYLRNSGVSGVSGIINSGFLENYVNNFLFLPKP